MYDKWKSPDKHQLSRGKYFENVPLKLLTQKDTTYVWMKNWKSLPIKEITSWTKNCNWFQSADTKTNTFSICDAKDWCQILCKKPL